MVNTCVVPGCNSRSNKDKHLSFHALPLSNKTLLKRWIQLIGRKNLPINSNSRVCSKHFNNSHSRVLRPDEYPTQNLPQLPTCVSIPKPQSPLVRSEDTKTKNTTQEEVATDYAMKEIGVNTDDIESEEMISLREIIHELECQVVALRREVGSSDKMRLSTIAADDSKVAFYTGFPSYDHLKACYNFLGPAVDNLEYKDSVRIFYKSNKGRPRCLSPLDEFFLVLI